MCMATVAMVMVTDLDTPAGPFKVTASVNDNKFLGSVKVGSSRTVTYCLQCMRLRFRMVPKKYVDPVSLGSVKVGSLIRSSTPVPIHVAWWLAHTRQ